MATPITAGTCVGVLYLDTKTKTIQVHNGRLKSTVQNPDKLTKPVTIIHVPTPALVPEELTITNPLAISRTPDFAPATCKSKPLSGFKSGTCFALTIKGGTDAKNGRFLYAITNDNKLTCTLPVNTKTHVIASNIKKVVYMHLNKVQQVFSPQIVERVNIQKAIALPLTATKKRTI